MTRLQDIARRLWDGSALILQRMAESAAAWVRRGRRDDLTGLAAVLGCILRALLLAAGLYLLWRLIRAFPNLLWLIVPVWCWRAIRAVPKAEPAELAPAEPPEPDARTAVLTLLYDVLGDRDAVHLSEVLQHLQAKGRGEGWKAADLRARLEALSITVAPKVKAGGKGPTRGIRRADLPPLSRPQETQASPAPSTAA